MRDGKHASQHQPHQPHQRQRGRAEGGHAGDVGARNDWRRPELEDAHASGAGHGAEIQHVIAIQRHRRQVAQTRFRGRSAIATEAVRPGWPATTVNALLGDIL